MRVRLQQLSMHDVRLRKTFDQIQKKGNDPEQRQLYIQNVINYFLWLFIVQPRDQTSRVMCRSSDGHKRAPKCREVQSSWVSEL